jgi:hypothetical protein
MIVSSVKRLPCAKPGGTQIHSEYSVAEETGMSYAKMFPKVGESSRISSTRSIMRPLIVRTSFPMNGFH